MLLLTRTTPYRTGVEEDRRNEPVSCRPGPAAVEVRELKKMGRHAVDTNMLFIDNLKVPAGDLVGEEGRGFYCLLDGLNPERILVAAEAVGIGRVALSRAVALCQGARCVRTPDRPEPGHRPSAGRLLCQVGSRRDAGDEGGVAVRSPAGRAAPKPTWPSSEPRRRVSKLATAPYRLWGVTGIWPNMMSSAISANAGCSKLLRCPRRWCSII